MDFIFNFTIYSNRNLMQAANLKKVLPGNTE